MQFEPFDKKVKDAADHHHPAYDEQAWNRMEKLLDKHLPNKEDNRRRFMFFLLLFLLAGIGTWLFISKPWQGNKKIAATNSVSEKDPASGSSVEDNPTEKILTPGSAENNITGSNETTDPSPVIENGQSNNIADQLFNETPAKNDLAKSNRPGNGKNDQTSFSVTGGNKRSSNKDNKENGKESSQRITEIMPAVQDPVAVVNEMPSNRKEPTIDDTKKSQPKEVIVENPVQKENPVIAKTETPEKQATETKKQKNKTSKKNSLFFSLSAGPDLSFVGSGNSSQVKLLAGAGIGFTIKDKFTLRTGFFTGRKIYSAKPSDYKAPPAFYSLYPYLEKVDANCKVYEIPLSLSYNFGKKLNWFISAGLSSFLMKEESYKYYYKYSPTGNTYTSNWTIKDQNSHYFSVGTLSAGYKHNIGKRVTVMAEPYVKIPFAGVGYGKVKLNSGGVLFTVGIKAF